MNDPCQIPIVIYAGETFVSLPIAWIDPNSNPINLTGYAALMTIRTTTSESNPPVAQVSSTSGNILLNGTLGTFQIYLTSLVTSTLPNPFNGVWDLWVYSSSGVATRMLGGVICVKQPITR